MTVKFFNTNVNNSGGSGVKINQVTKLNVVAPHETIIDIPFTSKFDKLPLEMLKIEGGELGVVETLCDFNNADSTDFEENEYVKFDGTMKPKTDYEFLTTLTTTENIYEFDFAEFDNLKEVVKIL